MRKIIFQTMQNSFLTTSKRLWIIDHSLYQSAFCAIIKLNILCFTEGTMNTLLSSRLSTLKTTSIVCKLIHSFHKLNFVEFLQLFDFSLNWALLQSSCNLIQITVEHWLGENWIWVIELRLPFMCIYYVFALEDVVLCGKSLIQILLLKILIKFSKVALRTSRIIGCLVAIY